MNMSPTIFITFMIILFLIESKQILQSEIGLAIQYDNSHEPKKKSIHIPNKSIILLIILNVNYPKLSQIILIMIV